MITIATKIAIVRIAMTDIAAEAAPGTCEDDTASDKTCRVTVFDWLPNLPTTLHVYSKSLVSVGISVSSRNGSVPFFIILSLVSCHSIVLMAKSVVQFSAARVPWGRAYSWPVILIPEYSQKP